VLPERDDEGNAQESAGNATEGQDDRIETIAVAKEKDRRYRKHHAGRGTVHAGGDRLNDVVLDDALPAQDATQNAEAENRGELRALDRKTQNQGRVADGYGDNDTQYPADDNGDPR
jgi:hypothetical protein